MEDSNPDIQLQDAVDDVGPDDLLDAVGDFEEHSEISSVVETSRRVGSTEYILPKSDDVDAPEVTCTLEEEFPDERVTSASRTIGHGLRPVKEAEQVEVDDDQPNVVVKIEI